MVVGNPSVLVRVLATFLRGPYRFHVRRKFSTGKTKGVDIFNYLNYFSPNSACTLGVLACFEEAICRIGRFCPEGHFRYTTAFLEK